jgi:CRISPR-associated protein Csd1
VLVQALAAYADSRLRGQMDDPAFERKPVALAVTVTPDGEFAGFLQLQQTVTRGKKTIVQAPEREVPKSPVNRNSGAHPLLAFDDAKYVFGPGPWTKEKQEEDHREKHEAFVKLVRAASAATNDQGLIALRNFYDRPEEVAKAKAAFDPRVTGGILLTLVGEGHVVDREPVRNYWRKHFDQRSTTRNESGGTGMCLISGRVGSIAPTHDKIKGAAGLGGQPAGVALMSFDKDAFCSYGWDKNQNSPVSPERARAYVLALNDLMSGFQKSRVDHAGTGFLYWTRNPASDDPLAMIEQADPGEVRRVVEIRRGSLTLSDPNDFYLVGVSGNGGRLVVRHWSRNSLEDVLRNVGAWFEDLQIADVFKSGEIADPPKLWQILRCLTRDGDPPADRAVQLIRRAIHGTPIGRTILAGALQRLRLLTGSARLEPVRISIIRAAVNDLIAKQGEMKMSEALDPTAARPPYLCGRLLALYDGLQRAAHKPEGGYAKDGAEGGKKEVNMKVSDRYYSLASTNPKIAFPKIILLGRAHLRKLRRDNPGAAINIEREIEAILQHFGGDDPHFQGQLSLEDQGRFAIGFHHQKAEGSARAKDRKAKDQKEEKERQ